MNITRSSPLRSDLPGLDKQRETKSSRHFNWNNIREDISESLCEETVIRKLELKRKLERQNVEGRDGGRVVV